MKTETYYLIYRTGTTPRVTSRRPSNLRRDEVAYTIRFNVPGNWGRVQSETLSFELPDGPTLGEAEPLEINGG